MKYLSIFLLMVMGTLFVQAALPTETSKDESRVGDYGLQDISWDVQVNASVPIVTVTGTIQDVLAHLTKLYPDYVSSLEKEVTKAREISSSGQDTTQSAWQPVWTDNPVPTDSYCNIFNWAQTWAINDGIAYLKQVYGTPVMGPGPGNCSRVSCSYNSAILMCNDNAYTKLLATFQDVANGTQYVVDKCTTYQIGESVSAQTNGQQFFADGWNIVVTYADC